MGKSPSIEEMEAKEDRYREYIHKLENELKIRADKYEDQLDKKINEYFKDNEWDYQNFLSGRNVDFLHEKDWSLDNLKNIIDQISKAIFGDTKAPAGVTIEKTEEMGKAIKNMEHLELYIAGKCFEIISGILDSFGTKTTMGFNASVEVKPVAPGLTLFVAVVGDSYQSHDFFEDEMIYQYFYIYDLRFSVKQAEAQAHQADVSLYADSLGTFRQKLEELNEDLGEDKIDGQEYATKTAIFENLMAKYEEKIRQLEAH